MNRVIFPVAVGVAVTVWFSLLPYTYVDHDPQFEPQYFNEPPLHEQGVSYVKNNQGLWIYTSISRPKGKEKGCIFVVHGSGEHSQRPGYQYLTQLFLSMDLSVISMDLQGHGRSGGNRVHVEKFEDYVDDAWMIWTHSLQRFPDLKLLPSFILGHSKGGLIVATLLANKHLQSPFQGVILSGPAFDLDPDFASPFMISVGKFLTRFLPKLGVIAKADPSVVMRNITAANLFLEDPFTRKTAFPLHYSLEILNAVAAIQHRMHLINTPNVLILHGTDDNICPLQGSKNFIDNISTPGSNKKLIVYDGLRHELFEETEESVFQDISLFIHRILNNSS